MDDKMIKKLLLSDNEDDMKIGWELLKKKKIPHYSHEWHQYFDCFHNRGTKNLHLVYKMITEICPDWTNNPMWKTWKPKKVEL